MSTIIPFYNHIPSFHQSLFPVFTHENMHCKLYIWTVIFVFLHSSFCFNQQWAHVAPRETCPFSLLAFRMFSQIPCLQSANSHILKSGRDKITWHQDCTWGKTGRNTNKVFLIHLMEHQWWWCYDNISHHSLVAMGAKCCAKHNTCTISFTQQNNSLKWISSLHPLCRPEKRFREVKDAPYSTEA